jgi:23S rRNA (cytidine1920-2'-O)/16S rRNA (cytidine1409-2'-O)-methyltransferase
LSKPRRPRFVALARLLLHAHPDAPPDAIADGRVLVDGRIINNPHALVRLDASVQLAPLRRLRGDIKLSYGLSELDVPVRGTIAADIGASAGGFTVALLQAGARKVYAVDAGVGQLMGHLRADPRVVNLEGRNLGQVPRELVPDIIDLVVMDLSYLSLSDGIPQLAAMRLHPEAHLVTLVKPTFELHRGQLAASNEDINQAVAAVAAAAIRSGWTPLGTAVAPSTGRRGAIECFLHAQRTPI